MALGRQHSESREHRFLAKILLFNSIGFCLLLSGVTYIDARLTTRVKFSARIYPHGYMIAIVGGIFVFATTLPVLKTVTSWRWRTALPSVILCVAGAVSLPFFRPEFPHAGVVTWTLYLALASLFSCGIHYTPPRDRWLSDSDLSEAVKTERIKEYTALWRTVAVSVTVGYLAILIPWTSFIWNLSSSFVSDRNEQLQLSQFGSAVLAGISLYFLFGVVFEAFAKANDAANLLLKIK